MSHIKGEIFIDQVDPERIKHDPYFTKDQPMSTAQFWWNHLTYKQREFIQKTNPNNHIDAFYRNSSDFHKMEDWPEDQSQTMRKI